MATIRMDVPPVGQSLTAPEGTDPQQLQQEFASAQALSPVAQLARLLAPMASPAQQQPLALAGVSGKAVAGLTPGQTQQTLGAIRNATAQDNVLRARERESNQRSIDREKDRAATLKFQKMKIKNDQEQQKLRETGATGRTQMGIDARIDAAKLAVTNREDDIVRVSAIKRNNEGGWSAIMSDSSIKKLEGLDIANDEEMQILPGTGKAVIYRVVNGEMTSRVIDLKDEGGLPIEPTPKATAGRKATSMVTPDGTACLPRHRRWAFYSRWSAVASKSWWRHRHKRSCAQTNRYWQDPSSLEPAGIRKQNS